MTSHAAIEQAAFRLFAERGFEGTALGHIAEAVGVTRRTLFRYYASKNDIPWGQFDRTLERFRDLLYQQPQSVPIHEAVARGVVAFNAFSADAEPHHAVRIRLILETPALQAHSALKYADWRAVVARFAAARRGEPIEGVVPQLLGHVALAIALTAYDQWLRSGGDDVELLLSLLMDAEAAMNILHGD